MTKIIKDSFNLELPLIDRIIYAKDNVLVTQEELKGLLLNKPDLRSYQCYDGNFIVIL